MEEDSLLVPITACMGIPVIIKAGMEISPPPPATASINPAKKVRGQTIR